MSKEKLFNHEIIKNIWNDKDPLLYTSIYIEEFLRKTTGVIDVDSNFISTLSEFHLNNLIFLKSIFPKDQHEQISVISDIMNSLVNLLDLSDEINHVDEEVQDKEVKELITENDDFLENKEKIDSIKLSKEKLSILKDDFMRMNSEGKLSFDNISVILSHLNKSYFPFIKLYYYFCNIERDEETAKIEFIINKPLEVLPLSNHTNYFDHKEEAERNEKKRNEDLKKKIEEEEAMEKLRKMTIDVEENAKLEEERKALELKNREKTYKDLIEELNMNEETKKIISDAIERMHLEVETKISDRQRKLDDRLKEVEEMIKGKKK